MPMSSESSSADHSYLRQTFLRLREELEQWWIPDRPDGFLARTLRRRLASLDEALDDPRDLLHQVGKVSEGQLCLIHIDRTEVRSLFSYRSASYERTAQIFGVDPDDPSQFHESVLDAQVECLYRNYAACIDDIEDEFWNGVTDPAPFFDRMYQLTLDALTQDECLFVECLAAARKREEDREGDDAAVHREPVRVGAAVQGDQCDRPIPW